MKQVKAQVACLDLTHLHDSANGMLELRKLCKECDVRSKCLEWGISTKETAFSKMIYGGLFPHELEELWKLKKLDITPQCSGCSHEFQVFNWNFDKIQHLICKE